LGGVGRIGEAIRLGLIRELRYTIGVISLIDEEQVFAAASLGVYGSRNVEIRPAVGVHVCHSHPTAPALRRPRIAPFRYIFELEVAFVEVECIGYSVAGEVQVRSLIAVKVRHGNAAAVVHKLEVENIESIVFRYVVGEIEATGLTIGEFKERCFGRRCAGAKEKQKEQAKTPALF